MLFNSIEFAIFLPIVFGVYWLIGAKRIQIQNIWLLITSYIFYGWWDYRFLGLISISAITDYIIGLLLNREKKQSQRKALLMISLIVNLGLLFFFKYFNFFIDNFISAFTFMGMSMKYESLKIILPVGISFYTFQTLSYTIDVYNKRIKSSGNILNFFAFVSFFPQLVAGPIERASNLLPQFNTKRVFNYDFAKEGLKLILWGLVKKIVIADSCAPIVNEIFVNYESLSPISLIIGACLFSFQIYGDFSGYSDIAIGTARLFGFKLMTNFRLPYFSKNITEFWRRWHISLYSWFTDYLYTPFVLHFRNGGKASIIGGILLTFLLSGLWHGANWTFIIWGGMHGAIIIFEFYTSKGRKKIFKKLNNKISTITSSLSVFIFWTISMVIFRSKDLESACKYLLNIFYSNSDIYFSNWNPILIIYVSLFIAWEWVCRKNSHGLILKNYSKYSRWSIYICLVWLILLTYSKEETFIYFQF